MTERRLKRLLSAVFVALLLLLLKRVAPDLFSDSSPTPVPINASVSAVPEGLSAVLKVVDGDTFDVLLDGAEERVRVIGMNTPETVDPRKPVECFGREASAHAKELLEGASVRLEADPTQDDRDRYGRLVRHVFLEDGRSFALAMIEGGFAYEYTYDAAYAGQGEYRAAEAGAKAGGKGLWGGCGE